MNTQIPRLVGGLIACAVSTWAAASDLPTHETYSAAADFGTNIFTYDPAYVPLLDVTAMPGATAQIAGAGYAASASTLHGSNHAYASASAFPSTVLGSGSFSGWYDRVTITGGSGTGTAHFTVQLNGIADVGSLGGAVGYTLGTSSVHPSTLTSELPYFNVANVSPWAMDAVTPIASYLLGASPYNDTSILFPATSSQPVGGIPSIPDLGDSLGGDPGIGFPTPDLILTPGAGQDVNVTLHGILNFTYGEAFYLIAGLDASIFGDGLESFEPFCSFDIADTCATIPKDGSGATTLDFSNSANLVNIALPEGASASFDSGASYNVTAVPEPAEWAMLLIGLGLIGWRVRRRS